MFVLFEIFIMYFHFMIICFEDAPDPGKDDTVTLKHRTRSPLMLSEEHLSSSDKKPYYTQFACLLDFYLSSSRPDSFPFYQIWKARPGCLQPVHWGDVDT